MKDGVIVGVGLEEARQLLIGHTDGGVARISKTKAVDTIESGPVFGTFGGAYMARTYGLKNVMCFDVGGTTTKCSIIRDGQPVFQRGCLPPPVVTPAWRATSVKVPSPLLW